MGNLSIDNVERKAQLLERIAKTDMSHEKIVETTIEILMEYPYSFESDKDIYDRA